MSHEFESQSQGKPIKNLTSEEAKQIASTVSKKFQEFKQARSLKEQKWNECIKAYLNQHNFNIEDNRKWRSKIYIPLCYEAVTNIYSNLKRSLFPTDSSFFAVDATTEDASYHTNVIKSWLLHQLDEMNFITKFGKFLKQLVVIGNSAAVIYWKTVSRKVREKVVIPELDENGVQIGEKTTMQLVERVVYDGPEFETINMLDVVFDPAALNWEDGMVIHRVYRTFDQIKANPVYKNIDGLRNPTEITKDRYLNDSETAFNFGDSMDKKSSLIKLYSAYGDFKVGDEIYYDHIAVVANDEYLIRFEPNPYPAKPFIFCVYESIPNEVYGTGAIEPGLGIQYLVNTFSNQKADVLSLLINGMWAYVDDGIIDPEEIVAKPGALIPVKDVANIRPLVPDTNVVLSYNEISQLKAEFQEITGATKYFTGGPNLDFSKTATEINALQNAGIMRFSEVIQNIEINALARVVKLVFLYNGLFNTLAGEVNADVDGYQNFIKNAQEMLNSNYRFRIIGSNSTISKEIKLSKLTEFLKMITGNPTFASQINVMALVKQLYRELGFKDENLIFNNQQQNVPDMQSMMNMQNLQPPA